MPCRIEKGFVHWGHEMAYTEAPHQLGLEFICKPNKSVPFIGRDAYLARKAEGSGTDSCVQSSYPIPNRVAAPQRTGAARW